MEVTLGQTVHKKSVVLVDHCSSRSLSMVPLDLCSSRSLSTVPLDLCSARRLVDRWHDSDDWKPYRQHSQNVTTAHCRASALSGRDTLDPSQIEK